MWDLRAVDSEVLCAFQRPAFELHVPPLQDRDFFRGSRVERERERGKGREGGRERERETLNATVP